jgi:hypothetical protein
MLGEDDGYYPMKVICYQICFTGVIMQNSFEKSFLTSCEHRANYNENIFQNYSL